MLRSLPEFILAGKMASQEMWIQMISFGYLTWITVTAALSLDVFIIPTADCQRTTVVIFECLTPHKSHVFQQRSYDSCHVADVQVRV